MGGTLLKILGMESGRHIFPRDGMWPTLFSRVGKLPKKTLLGLDCKFVRKIVKFELKLRLEIKLTIGLSLR